MKGGDHRVGYFRDQRAFTPPKKNSEARKALGELIFDWAPTVIPVVLVVGFASFLVWSIGSIFAREATRDQQGALYPLYTAQHVGEELAVTITQIVDLRRQSEVVKTPIIALPQRAAVTFPRGEHFILTRTGGAEFGVSTGERGLGSESQEVLLRVPHSSWSEHFGSINLGPQLGLPITLHVLNVETGGIKFTHEYNN